MSLMKWFVLIQTKFLFTYLFIIYFLSVFGGFSLCILVACGGFSMETEVGIVENERKIVESGAAEDGSTLSPNQIADPVVYKLVRVSSFTYFD